VDSPVDVGVKTEVEAELREEVEPMENDGSKRL
jgi:hypothetical protein